jgi:hypothetical protein
MIKIGHFPDEVGPMGTYIEKWKEPQIKVLRGNTYRNKEGYIFRTFLTLYPGDINSDIVKNQLCSRCGKAQAHHCL